MTTTNKSLGDVIKEEKKKFKTENQTFADFPVGTRVRVISPHVDFRFFRGTETGMVSKNSGRSIIVEFDTPMVYEDGHKVYDHNFDPDDLVILRSVSTCIHCGK